MMTTYTPLLFWVDYHPSFCFVAEAVFIWDGELSDEVHQCLHFNSRLRVLLNFELSKLDGLLDHSSYCLGLVHGLLNWLVHHYQDGVRLK